MLKVRNVTYNEQGIKTGSGAWRTFYGQIHGYEHQPNLRQIIRLNAYNNPDSKETHIISMIDLLKFTIWMFPCLNNN